MSRPISRLPNSAGFVAHETRNTTNLYAHFIRQMIEEAIDQQVKYETGAHGLLNWAKSSEGQNILTWAGLTPGHSLYDQLESTVLSKALMRQAEAAGLEQRRLAS